MRDSVRDGGLWTLTFAVLLAAIWLAGHPYFGIDHDGPFYAAEALRWLDPGFLDDDILFAHGFQGRFTVFPALYGSLAAALGLEGATFTLYVLGQASWLIGALALIGVMVAAPSARWILLLALAALPGEYGANRIFAYAEPYATPRLFAEAMVLLGLALLLGRRRLLAGLALAAALVLHPLIAWPGAGVALLFEASRPGRARWRWWLAVAAAATLPIVLALAGVAPFSRLFEVMDEAWYAVVEHRDAYALVGNWNFDEYARPVALTLFVLLARRFVSGNERRLGAVLLGVVAGGFAASWALGEGLRDLLVINAQPWRAVWLLTVIANLSAARILLGLWSGSSEGERWTLALYLGALLVWFLDRFFHVGGVMTVVALSAAGLAILARERLMGGGLRMLARVLLALCVVGSALAAVGTVGSLFFIAPVLDLDTIFVREMTVMAPAAVVLLVAVLAPRRRVASVVGGVVVLALALGIADRRSDWMRYHATREVDAELRRLLPEGRSVYWESGVTFLWFALGRASYLSCVQGSASIFNRDLAIAYGRRHAVLAAMELAEFRGVSVCRPRRSEARRMAEGEPGERLAHACRKLPDLDLLVLDAELADVRHRTWTAPLARVDEVSRGGGPERRSVRRFHIYDCAQFR